MRGSSSSLDDSFATMHDAFTNALVRSDSLLESRVGPRIAPLKWEGARARARAFAA